MEILQVGLGNFGKRHLAAWQRLGLLDRLWVAEPDRDKWPEVGELVPAERLVSSLEAALPHVHIVDIVTPTQTHAELCRQALGAGKDVFIEKPMTMTAADARQVVELAEKSQRLIQVGYYYRFHPASQRLKAEIVSGRLGALRYLTGDFCGFKRARTDVGVMHTDGIHFLDLFNWLIGAPPQDVYAVCRDHFRRGLEDFAVALLTYPGGTVGKVEAGYIQPGRWDDKVVAGAKTTKNITAVGERGTAEIDFEAETLILTEVRHEPKLGTWVPAIGTPVAVPIESCDPVALVSRELEAFLEAVRQRQPTLAGPVECGVHLAVLMESLYESNTRREAVPVEMGEAAPIR